MSLRKFLRGQLDRYFGSFARKADLDNLYRQLGALLEIRAMLGEAVPLRDLRGWAISPDALAIVLRDIQIRQNPKVIEFGAGESTLAVAALLDRMGSGSLISVEHNEAFCETIAKRLAFAGLEKRVVFRTPGMRQYDEVPGVGSYQSYDLSALDKDFDVALVDGPIVAAFGAGARLAPLEWCLSGVGNSASVYLDDANRRSEQRIIAHLRAQYPDLECRPLDVEKGLCHFCVRS